MSRCKYEPDTCVVDAGILGNIEIVGHGIRAALAELFIAGGCIDLQLAIEVKAECGEVDKITLKAEGLAVADMT